MQAVIITTFVVLLMICYHACTKCQKGEKVFMQTYIYVLIPLLLKNFISFFVIFTLVLLVVAYLNSSCEFDTPL